MKEEKKMKKMIANSITGIGLILCTFLFATATATATEPSVTCDGKTLSFPPDEKIGSVNLESLDFNFTGLPPDKEYVKGTVFAADFGKERKSTKRHFTLGYRKYVLFTKLDEAKAVALYVPISGEPYLDCEAGASNEYRCRQKGSEEWKWRIIFAGGNITMKYGSDWETILVAIGKVPVPPADRSQTNSP
jgi:hypothetical protein